MDSNAPTPPTAFGLAFGLGPMPGTDLVAAADVVMSETPLPHVPQLPARGIGHDPVGRTAALLDIPVDRGPRGWRVAPRPRTQSRLRDQMDRDLDVLEELWAGKTDWVKTQFIGPWTLAAEIEMPNGHRMITDPGALRDLTESLLGAVGEHCVGVGKRIAQCVLQLDEPLLADVMAGTLRGATDYEAIPAFPEPEERLAPFGALINAPVLINVPWQTATPAVAAENAGRDRLAGLLDRGSRVALPAMEPAQFRRLFDELQLDPAECALDVYAQPGATLAATVANYRAAREMADAIATGA